ncbi:MAG: Asp23/Gls24 family envelope stress response protein [Acutalibacteraceae bacterium]
MIAYETKTGTITVSNEYFAKLIGNATSSCFGVAGMAPHGRQKIRRLFSKKDYTDSGVRISGNFEVINVDLHIIVAYGMNINAIAKSITEKVKYVVTEATGISVGKVTVRIDGIKE